MEILLKEETRISSSLFTRRDQTRKVDREEVSLIVGYSAWNQRFQERVYLQRDKEQTNKSATPDFTLSLLIFSPSHEIIA